MYKKAVITILFLILGFSQGFCERYDYHTDTLTWGQYGRGEWEALYDTIQEANKQGIGFYYLHLRGGVAAYYTKRYQKAVSFFRRAEEIAACSDEIKRTHYLSAVYSGMPLEAVKMYAQLPDTMRKEYDDPSAFKVKSISMEYGYNFLAGYDSASAPSIHGDKFIYGEKSVPQNSTYYHALVNVRVSPRIEFMQSFQYLNVKKKEEIYALQYLPVDTLRKSFNTNISQWQYYSALTFQLSDRLSIAPAFSLFHFTSNYYKISYISSFDDYNFTPDTISGYEYLYSLAANYHIDRLYLQFSGSYYDKYNENRWQTGLSIGLYPFRNNSLYVDAGMYIDPEKVFGNTLFETSVARILLGWDSAKFSLLAGYTFGNLKDYNELNGLLMYNTIEPVKKMVTLTTSVPVLNNQLVLSLYYKYITYNDDYTFYKETNQAYTDYYHINNHSFTGGVTWKF